MGHMLDTAARTEIARDTKQLISALPAEVRGHLLAYLQRLRLPAGWIPKNCPGEQSQVYFPIGEVDGARPAYGRNRYSNGHHRD